MNGGVSADWALAWLPAVVSAVLVGLACLGVPALVRRVPEPAPGALDDPRGEGDGEEPVAADLGPALPPVAEPDAEPVAEPGVQPVAEPEPPKELYVDVAATPGLAWRSALAGGLAAGLVGLRLGWDQHLVVLLPLVPVLVALSVIDWRTRLLPTRLVAPSYVLVVVLVLVTAAVTRDGDDLARAGWGWLVYGGFFFAMWFVYPPGLGYGDVRLSGVLGIALGNLGWEALLLGIWSGTLLGGVLGVVLTRLGVVDRRNNPFGPYMVLGALLGVLLGTTVLSL